MDYLLDTNVAIRLRDNDERAKSRVEALKGAIGLSAVTRMELEGGVYSEPAQAGVRRARVDLLLRAFPVLAFDNAAAEAYGRIVLAAGYSRRKVIDRMIAAQALTAGAALVTYNPGDFRDVQGLKLLEW